MVLRYLTGKAVKFKVIKEISKIKLGASPQLECILFVNDFYARHLTAILAAASVLAASSFRDV